MEQFVVNAFFTLLVLLTVVPAVLVVLTLNIVRAACWLLLSLSGAAGLFFFLGADFVGAIQLLIYVGGTLVLVIFGVMLTATGPFVNLSGKSGDWVLAAFGGVAMFGILGYGLAQPLLKDPAMFPPDRTTHLVAPTSNRIGMSFLGFPEAQPDAVRDGKPHGSIAPPARFASGYLLPFEIVSVHLVVVLIGAAYLARAKRKIPKEA